MFGEGCNSIVQHRTPIRNVTVELCFAGLSQMHSSKVQLLSSGRLDTDGIRQQAKTEDERQRYVLAYLSLVKSIARRMKRQLPDGFDLDDLVGAGNLGLVLAAAHFSPGPIRTTVTAAEAAYARLRIRRAINESVRGEPYRWETLRSELKKNIAQPEPEERC